ncbi:hypothetical protein D0962_15745 [Leptolyngbyaceae cyanobacterium CCMR0082]|uniref:Uncharacterized protein n=2 Tax=Adonisia turfae TaxID=2950184 RepID=A0A6M0S6Z7_9CYAN|nr:hypothetical protein [Adonisia turfae]NEZ60676.1 hypothetical protein [Adonisia turfae CCMR0081]NEZ64225.1 hypothetical protein [Adonisia turfae CCMR0082]
MEIAKLLLEYIKVLAWPSVILTIVLMFRKQIESLIKRLEKADLPGGVSISLRAEILEAKKLSEQVIAEPLSPQAKGVQNLPLTEANLRMIKLGLQPSPSGLNVNYYRDLVEDDPNLALAGLRLEVDVLAKNLATGFGIDVTPKDSGGRLIKKLHDAGSITLQQAQLIQKILKLANAGIDGTSVSYREASQIINIAGVLVNQYIAWLSWGFDDGWQPRQKR